MDRRRFLGMLAAGLATAAAQPVLNLRAVAAALSGAAAHGAGVATDWFDLAGDLVRTAQGFTPPVASRAFGYMGVTLYETLVPGMPRHRSLAGVLNELEPPPAAGRSAAYDWPSAANAAMAQILRRLIPTTPAPPRARIDALEASLARTGPPGLVSRSVDRGRQIADFVYDWSRGDGGHEGYLRNFPTDYDPPQGDGLWRPTPPGFQRALQPTWGNNRPFLLHPGTGIEPGPPTPYSADPHSECFAEAVEVYDTVRNLTAEQREIALFWSDDPGLTATPPGHSVAILTGVLRDHEANLEQAAEAYAKLGIAVADAFIACWHTKYATNVLRPVTYIADHIDPAFADDLPLTTPPFPEYTSGHSVQSGAFAEVMTGLFGTVAFTDRTHEPRGLHPRSFTSFENAAAEAAISRLYGGIHFRPAIERGLVQGTTIGRLVNGMPIAKNT